MNSEKVILWLVRHGETVANAQGKISGWHDVDLSPRGRAMAEALRPLLTVEDFDTVVASDLKRARDTARLAYGEPEVDRRLKELDFGSLEGQCWTEIPEPLRDAVLAFSEHCAPGGELISRFQSRVFEYIEELSPGRHLLFVHGGVIRLILRQVGADQFVPPTSDP
jgi:probable phosphoglycerate mutase